MKRTITVRGLGRLTLKPDRVEIPITLSVRDKEYAVAAGQADAALSALSAALEAARFEPETLKTRDLSLSPVFEGRHDEHGNYQQVFVGYECRHSLILAFPLEGERLSAALDALASCSAKPEFSVQFTVADTEAAKTALLGAAAEDGRRKAETLCAASGVHLGELIHIDYGVGQPNLYSPTRLMMNDAVAAPRAAMKLGADIRPDDITADESAVFVWLIE